jgi:hypothetical protein
MKLIPWSRLILEELILVQLVNKLTRILWKPEVPEVS